MEHVYFFDGNPKKISWVIKTGESTEKEERTQADIHREKITEVQSKYVALHAGIFWSVGRYVIKNDDTINVMLDSKSMYEHLSKSKETEDLFIQTKTMKISGDVKKVIPEIISNISNNQNSCLIFGGETTVNVIGDGSGGRNQELVLRLLKNLQKINQNFIISSMGTDGIDGNTNYAGAIIEKSTFPQDEMKEFLKNNDSNSFFNIHGGLIKTGHTQTNLMDIGLVLT